MISNLFHIDAFYETIVPFLDDADVNHLGNVSKEVGCNTYITLIKNQLKDPIICRWKKDDQMQMARQTYKIIINSRFKIGKQYQCLKALSAALLTTSCCEPESFLLFRKIALADIPHFILTRCWQIEMTWHFCHYFSHPAYNPITERALSALIQAQKNFLTCRIGGTGSYRTYCIPHIIFTEGNRPKVGPLTNQNTKQANFYININLEEYRAAKGFGVCNVRFVTEQEDNQVAREINKSVIARSSFLFI